MAQNHDRQGRRRAEDWSQVLRLIPCIMVTAALCGCADSGGTIRFLRSDTHTFTRAERRVISAISSAAIDDARRLLPALPKPIELTVRPGHDVIAETGESGTATPPNGIVWTVDAARQGGAEAVARAWLRASLFHELHHLARGSAGTPATLIDLAVFEGLATVFERDHAGVQPPWGAYPRDVEEWADELLALPAGTTSSTFLYAHPDGRKWFGIRVGTYWVDRAMKATGRPLAELALTPAAEILRMSNASSRATAK